MRAATDDIIVHWNRKSRYLRSRRIWNYMGRGNLTTVLWSILLVGSHSYTYPIYIKNHIWPHSTILKKNIFLFFRNLPSVFYSRILVGIKNCTYYATPPLHNINDNENIEELHSDLFQNFPLAPNMNVQKKIYRISYFIIFSPALFPKHKNFGFYYAIWLNVKILEIVYLELIQ